jgi:uncharacterized membrane protein YkoI
MSRFRLFLVVLISALLVGSGIALWAAAKDDDEEKVPLSEVPKVVLDAAKAKVPGGTITAAEMETEDGVTTYDVVIVLDGVEYEVEVTADGTVKEVEKEGDDEEDSDEEDDADEDSDQEEEVALSDVPVIVLEAAKEAVPDGNIKKVEKEVEDGEAIYDVEMVVRYEVEVTAKGEVKEVEIENDEDDDDEKDEDDDD